MFLLCTDAAVSVIADYNLKYMLILNHVCDDFGDEYWQAKECQYI